MKNLDNVLKIQGSIFILGTWKSTLAHHYDITLGCNHIIELTFKNDLKLELHLFVKLILKKRI